MSQEGRRWQKGEGRVRESTGTRGRGRGEGAGDGVAGGLELPGVGAAVRASEDGYERGGMISITL